MDSSTQGIFSSKDDSDISTSLPGEPKEKKTPKLNFNFDFKNLNLKLIGIIAGIVVAIVIVVLVLINVVPKISSSSSKTYTVSLSMFNTYANYLLYGEESAADVSDFSQYDDFYIDTHYSDENYIYRLRELYNSFAEDLAENQPTDAELATNPELSSIVAAPIDEETEFLLKINSEKYLDDTALLNRYLSQGSDSVRSYIDNFHKSYDGENEYLAETHAADSARALILVEYWDFYATRNCIINSRIDDLCANNLLNEPETNDLAHRLGEAEAEFNDALNDARYSLKSYCRTLNKILKEAVSSNEA